MHRRFAPALRRSDRRPRVPVSPLAQGVRDGLPIIRPRHRRRARPRGDRRSDRRTGRAATGPPGPLAAALLVVYGLSDPVANGVRTSEWARMLLSEPSRAPKTDREPLRASVPRRGRPTDVEFNRQRVVGLVACTVESRSGSCCRPITRRRNERRSSAPVLRSRFVDAEALSTPKTLPIPADRRARLGHRNRVECGRNQRSRRRPATRSSPVFSATTS